jgi:hypothetical protein
MKLLIRFMICSLLFLQACKKDSQTTSPDLNISGFGPVAVATGDAVSIYGSGFDPNPDNNVVSFNGVNGEVASASPNRLQVIVPLLTTSGKITVSAHGKSVTSSQTYTIVNVLQGTYASSFILTPDKKYLLRGAVVFNSKLIIGAGTVIYGEKLSHASLTAKDIDFEGTADKPIIFTSDQAPGSRYPGDWTGLIINNSGTDPKNNGILPVGTMEYVRIEYAGYGSGAPGIGQGTALNLVLAPNSILQYIQTSYSAGAGISLNGTGQFNTVGGFIHHIVAFGCLGSDFLLTGNGVVAQYGFGLKDPYYAAVAKGDGIVVANVASSNVTSQLSNFTLVGYNPDARNILNLGPTITNNAGSGIRLGINYVNPANGGYPANAYGGQVAIYNSVIAASWQAGVNIANNAALTNYESANFPCMIRNSFITGTSAAQLPVLGGAFGFYLTPANNLNGVFTNNAASASKRALFASFNDTTRVLSFSGGKDDLGIKTLTDYSRLNNPGVLPASGSLLLNSASFPLGSYAINPFFNKDVTFVGAFGTQDWTKPWCNFSPQTTQY